jgi:hypothetical protein
MKPPLELEQFTASLTLRFSYNKFSVSGHGITERFIDPAEALVVAQRISPDVLPARVRHIIQVLADHAEELARKAQQDADAAYTRLEEARASAEHARRLAMTFSTKE